MADTRELILKFSGDPRQLRQALAQIRSDLAQFSQGQVAVAQGIARQTQQSEQRRVADTIRSANLRLREEQKAAREVARITAETARQAAAQERIRERAAQQLANVQIREAKRAARELERSLGQSRAGAGGGGALIGSIAGRIPGVGNLASEFSSVSSAAASAGPAIAAVAGPIAAVTVGAAALTAGLVAVGVKLFELTKQTADFQGKFFDLSQQVGVSVETLSTLDVIASTTGGNIETVTASLAIFQKRLENAHDPTSEEAKLLKELGVTSLDTEVALRQTIKGLFALGETTKQTDSVLLLFGRSGRFVNAILKESKGDIDAAAKSFGQHLVVTTQAAIAADKFNDELALLNRTFVAVTAQITSQTIPVFTLLFKELNKALTGNAEDWRAWGEVVESQVLGVAATIRSVVQFIASRGTLDFGVLFEGNLRGLIDQARKLRAEIDIESQIAFAQRLARTAGTPGDTPDPDKARKDAQSRANKDLQLQQQALEESTRVHREELERQRRLDLVSIDEWETQSKQALDDHRKTQESILNQESLNIKKFVANQADARLAEREIQQKRTKLLNNTLTALQKVQEDAQKRRDQLALDVNQQILELTEADRQRELDLVQRALSRQEITEEGAAIRRLAILEQGHIERIKLIEIELEQETTSASRKIALDNKRIRSEQEYTAEKARLTQERIDALLKEGAAGVPAPGGRVPEGIPIIPIDVGLPPPPDTSLWEQALGRLRAIMVDFSTFAKGTFVGVFEGIAGAVAQGVEAWALYGESIGQAMKKALAGVLARIAGESAAMAALHGIYALASLAFLDFRGAAAHALVAAQFAGLAAAYGLSARAIAGNSFRSSGGGSAGSGGGGDGNNNGPQPLQTIVQGRNQPQRQVVEHVIRVESNDSHIVKVVGKNWREGGEIRELSFNDGGAR